MCVGFKLYTHLTFLDSNILFLVLCHIYHHFLYLNFDLTDPSLEIIDTIEPVSMSQRDYGVKRVDIVPYSDQGYYLIKVLNLIF